MLALLLAGLSVATCGLQLLVFVQLPNAIAWGPPALLLLGVTMVVVSVQVNDVRVPATLAALL